MGLTGFSAVSTKKILMTTSNSPQPVSLISYGGLVRTGGEKRIEEECLAVQLEEKATCRWGLRRGGG